MREYGEESNWRSLQNKIVKARLSGGLHSTGQLVDLIRNSTFNAKGRFPFLGTFLFSQIFRVLLFTVLGSEVGSC